MSTYLYVCRDRSNSAVYVGITEDMAKRMRNHQEKSWWTEVAWVETTPFDSRGEAVDAEKEAIGNLKPKYNRQHNSEGVQWSNERYVPIRGQAEPEYVSIAEASKEVGVNPKTIRRWISAGRIHGYRFGPRMIRVDRTEMRAMLKPLATANLDHLHSGRS